LRGKGRSYERSRPGDGSEVVSEDHPSIRREIVAPVLQSHGGRRAPVVDDEDLRRDHASVESIADSVAAERSRE
jgi:hypothetical protein